MKKSDKRAIVIIAIILLILAFLTVFFLRGKITGNVSLNLNSNYEEGKTETGKLEILLDENEVLPENSQVIIQTADNTYSYNLSDIADEESILAEEIYPELSFALKIFEAKEEKKEDKEKSDNKKENADESTEENKSELVNETLSNENISEENQINDEEGTNNSELDLDSTDSEETITPEATISGETAAEETFPETDETEVEQEIAPITGGVISNFFKKFAGFFKKLNPTGSVVSESEKVIEGLVSKNSPFSTEIKENAGVKVVKNSVVLKETGEVLNENEVTVKIEKEEVIVTTEYSNKGKKKEILIDLEKLQIEQEIEKISLLDSSGNEIMSKVFAEKEEITLENNATDLTEKEKETLKKKFGNASIKTTTFIAEDNTKIIRLEIGEYWLESSYDYSLTEEEIDEQIEDEKNRWLKDIVKSLAVSEKTGEINSEEIPI